MNTSIIIQARVGSTRLPNKILLKLGKHRVIEWVFRRLQLCTRINSIILATTKKKEDDIICKIAEKNKIYYFRGSEHNVLKRYIDTADHFNISKIIRICADRPFVDPKLIDKLVNNFNPRESDLVYNHIPDKFNLWPIGFGGEILETKTLKQINTKLLKKKFKEHVTLYLYNNPKYRVKALKAFFNFESNERFDLDTLNDYKKLSKLSKNLDLNDSFISIINKFNLY